MTTSSGKPKTLWFFSSAYRLLGRFPASLPPGVKAICVKELAACLREQHRIFMLTAVVSAAIGSISYLVFTVPQLRYAESGGLEVLAALVSGSQALGPGVSPLAVTALLSAPFLVVALASWATPTLLGASCVGLEGRAYAVWVTSPLGRRGFLAGKWLAHAIFGVAVGMILELVAFVAVGPFYLPGLVLGTVATILGASLSAVLAVGTSALYARLDWDNPAHATKRGATLYRLIVLGVLLLLAGMLSIVAAVVALSSGVPVVVCVFGALLLWLIAASTFGLWILHRGARKLEDLEW